MGKLNIAHHKSYHPYRQDNIARVRRDEAKAKLKEQQEEDRALLADAESRLDTLRQRADGAGAGAGAGPLSSAEAGPSHLPTTSSLTSASLSSASRHINLFEDLEQQSLVLAARPPKKSASAPDPDLERGVALAPPKKDLNPWYTSRSDKDKDVDIKDARRDGRQLRELARKSRADPLAAIPPHIRHPARSRAPTAAPTAAPTRPAPAVSTGPTSSSPPSSTSTSTTALAQARLERESSERARALALIRRKQREREAEDAATPSTVHGGYGDVFNRADVAAAHRDWGRREGWRDRRWDEGERESARDTGRSRERGERKEWEGGGRGEGWRR